jgi:adenylyltransferase/sulfurtransferase
MLPEVPPPGAAPGCAEAGVLGVLPGILGSLQAMEAIKLILGIGEPPLGRLIAYDALRTSFRQLRLRRDPACRLCGTQPTITSVDNPQTRSPQACAASTPVPGMTPAALDLAMASADPPLLVDVRDPHEHALAAIPGSTLIPLPALASRLAEIPLTRAVVLHCKSGLRSSMAASLLLENGFTSVSHLDGGIDAWLRPR